MQLSFQSFGAAEEVTGSKHLFQINGKRILLDCGLFQGRRAESYEKNCQFPFEPASIEATILSHGHCDHCGNLPMLVKQGYEGNIYSTTATRDIANLIMTDTAFIMARDYEYIQRNETGKFAYPPLFDQRDVLAALGRFITLSYHRPFPVADGISCQFLNAGHILGSSLVQLDIRLNGESRRVAFTGDLGRPGMPIVSPPDVLPPLDYLICEGTYGNRLHDPISAARYQLGEVIRETIHRGGKVIIPAFAVGRTQELIYFLHLLKDDNKIPDVDIFVDSPMAVNATSIFRVHQECYNEKVMQGFIDHHLNPFGFEKLHYVTDLSQSKALNERSEPCIIISASGMCEAGRILHHLKNNVAEAANTILIVGYMAENTLGRALADRKPTVKIFGNEYPLKARVKILNTFSAHADYEDIRAYVGQLDLDRLKCVYLVHGEVDALANLQQVLLKAGVRSVKVVEAGKQYQLN